MLRKTLASAAALLVLSPSAQAHHDLGFTVAQSTYVAGAHADVSLYVSFGGYEPVSMDVDVPEGYQAAQQSGTGPWPASDNPGDEEVIGSGAMTARWAPFCGPSTTVSLTLKWESTIPLGAPAGTVALWTLEAALGLFTTEVYVVREGADDYVLQIASLSAAGMCSSTTDGSMTLTVRGTTADGSRVFRNPATPGSYTWSVSYVDTAGGTHSDSATVAITS